MSVPSFSAEKIFRDPQNFPYGFARSGEFTTQQAQLLEKNGNAYKALETEEQFNHLLGFGCEVAQGYLLNKPMPMSELIAQITETRKIREHNIQRITR